MSVEERNEGQKTTDAELLQLVRETHAQTLEMNQKLDEQAKRAATTGAIAGGIAGGLIATGIELLKAKFGW